MMSRLFPALIILGAIGIFLGYVNPTYTGPVAAASKQIQSYDQALDAASKFAVKQKQLESQKNDIPADQLARLNAFLPDSVDNVQLILDLNSLAARSGIQLSDFSINQPSTAPADGGASADGSIPNADQQEPTDSIDLSVKASGTYAAFRTFLAGIENSLRPLDVVELTVTDSQTGVYTYDMTLRIYWLR